MKKPVTVMTLDNSFKFGGSIVSLYHLTRGLDKGLIAPVVISAQPEDYLQDKFSNCQYYHYVPKLTWVDNRIYSKIKAMWPFRSSTLLRKLLTKLRFIYWLVFVTFPEACRYYRIGRRHHVSVLHMNNAHLHLPWLLAAKLLRVPCVAHQRGFLPFDAFSCFCASMVEHHVAISTSVKEHLAKLGVPDQRISLVHNAVDTHDFKSRADLSGLREEFKITEGQPTYGLFGRVIEWKGTREFIMSAKIVSEKFPGAVGFVVGDASDDESGYFQEMKQLVKALGLEQNIIFTSYRKDVAEMMALMDVVVHASTDPEPFGRVIIEAMAVNKPVVATRAGGPLDIVVDGETGYLVEPKDADALGEAICKLLKDRSLCQAMGQKGKARVETLFNNQMYAQKMERVFLNLVSQRQIDRATGQSETSKGQRFSIEGAPDE